MKVDALYTEGVNLRVLKDQPGEDLISLVRCPSFIAGGPPATVC
jgi:hypothetical protein